MQPADHGLAIPALDGLTRLELDFESSSFRTPPAFIEIHHSSVVLPFALGTTNVRYLSNNEEKQTIESVNNYERARVCVRNYTR